MVNQLTIIGITMILAVSCAGPGSSKKNKSSQNRNKKTKKTLGAEMIIRDSNALINESRDIIKALSSDFDKIENLRIENENNLFKEQENTWSDLLASESKDGNFLIIYTT